MDRLFTFRFKGVRKGYEMNNIPLLLCHYFVSK